MIKEAYVGFEVAKLLEEKGFNEKTFTYFDDDLLCHGEWFEWNNSPMGQMSAPTHQMAMAWLREKGIHISPKYCCFQGPKKNDKPYYKWEDRVLKLSSGEQIHPDVLGIHEYYSSYEDAVEAALKYCLENLI